MVRRGDVKRRGTAGRKAWALLLLGIPLHVGGQEVTELPSADRPLSVSMSEEFRIGGVTGEEWEMLTQVSSVAFDGEGRLHVFDGRDQSLIRLGTDGRFQRQFIRPGDGPGEISLAGAAGVEPDGTVMVMDRMRRSLYWFSPDGELMATDSNDPMTGDPIPADPLLPHPSGGLVSAGGTQVFTGGPGARSADNPRSLPILHFRRGQATRTLFEAWRPPVVAPPSPSRVPGMGAGGGQGYMVMPAGAAQRAFDPVASVGVLPDGRLIVSDTVTWRLNVIAVDGSVERILTRPFEPRPVTRQDRETERTRRFEALDSGPEPQIRTQGGAGMPMGMDMGRLRESSRARIEALEFADAIPVISRIQTDWDGRTWILRSGRRLGEPGPLDVISASGDYLGTIPAGSMEMPVAFGPGGLAAFVELDEFEVPSVVVRRIRLDRE